MNTYNILVPYSSVFLLPHLIFILHVLIKDGSILLHWLRLWRGQHAGHI